MPVRDADSRVSSEGIQPQVYGFAQAVAHVGRNLYTICPREGESFYLQKFLIHLKGSGSFAEIRRVNYVQRYNLGIFARYKVFWLLMQSANACFLMQLGQFCTIHAFCHIPGQRQTMQSARPLKHSSWHVYCGHLQSFQKASELIYERFRCFGLCLTRS